MEQSFPHWDHYFLQISNRPKVGKLIFVKISFKFPKNSRKIFQSVTSSPGAKLRSPEVCLDGIFERPRSKITSAERSRILLRILQIFRARTKFWSAKFSNLIEYLGRKFFLLLVAPIKLVYFSIG